jgi:hypothetical protein
MAAKLAASRLSLMQDSKEKRSVKSNLVGALIIEIYLQN